MSDADLVGTTIGKALSGDRDHRRAERFVLVLRVLEGRLGEHEARGTVAPVPLIMAIDGFREQLAVLRFDGTGAGPNAPTTEAILPRRLSRVATPADRTGR